MRKEVEIELAAESFKRLAGREAQDVCFVASGGHNRVFRASVAGENFALRLGDFSEGALEGARSFAGWAQALAGAGAPTPKVIAHDQKPWRGMLAMLMSWEEGQEIEKALPALSVEARARLGRQIASWQQAIGSLAHPAGVGYLLWGGGGPGWMEGASWGDFLREHLCWRMRTLESSPCALEAGMELRRQAVALCGRLEAMVEGAQSAPVALFAWDGADRNVLVGEDGLARCLVDLDSMMVGDPLAAPAFASATFEANGVPQEHAWAWREALGASKNEPLRWELYQGLRHLGAAAGIARALSRGEPAPGHISPMEAVARLVESSARN